jgi:hypothetical protein
MTRDWWEDMPRDKWHERATSRPPEIADKSLRDFMRYQDEAWAMREMRSAGVQRVVVYR